MFFWVQGHWQSQADLGHHKLTLPAKKTLPTNRMTLPKKTLPTKNNLAHEWVQGVACMVQNSWSGEGDAKALDVCWGGLCRAFKKVLGVMGGVSNRYFSNSMYTAEFAVDDHP